VRGQSQRRHDLAPKDFVLDELLAWRTNAGRVANLDPSIFCSDEVLQRISQVRPTNIEELSAIEGLGLSMAQRVGHRILVAIQRGIDQSEA
jgi:ribonuclease D